MHTPKWIKEGLKEERGISEKWRPLGANNPYPEAHLGHLRSQNGRPLSKEADENVYYNRIGNERKLVF